MPVSDGTARNRQQAFAVVAVLCTAFVLSQFYRSSVGVVGPELMATLALSEEALGVLGGTFYLVFGAAQIPVGIALDRFGPRLVNSGLLLVAAAGALVFAAAPDAGVLTFGRALMGVGCAAGLMGSLVVYARWFPRERFSAMAGLTLAVGGLGVLVATAPLALAADVLGWRGAFAAAAAVTVAVAGMVWLVVRDAPPGAEASHSHGESFGQSLRGVGTVLTTRELHKILPLNAVAYASLITVLGLWGAPYLTDVHGLDLVQAGDVLMAMAVTFMAGSLSYGWLAPRLRSYKRPVLFGAASSVLLFLALAFLPPERTLAVVVLLAISGLLGSYSVLLLSHIRTLFPDHMVGRGLTAGNLFNFGGVGLVQAASGWIVGAFGGGDSRPAIAYTALYLFLAAIVTCAATVYAFSRDPFAEGSPSKQ